MGRFCRVNDLNVVICQEMLILFCYQVIKFKQLILSTGRGFF